MNSPIDQERLSLSDEGELPNLYYILVYKKPTKIFSKIAKK